MPYTHTELKLSYPFPRCIPASSSRPASRGGGGLQEEQEEGGEEGQEEGEEGSAQAAVY